MAKHSVLLLLMALAATMAVPSTAICRKLMFLVQPQPNLLTYHNGAVLSGDIPVSILWYGRFTPAQKAVVSDFLLSLSSAAPQGPSSSSSSPAPSVAQWWSSINQLYLSKAEAAVSKNGAHGGRGGSKQNARVILSGQCPGQCAWPFHQPAYGPQAPPPLVPPSGDAGMDGVVISVASMVAGAVTNPFGDGFYQGDSAAPLEAATACEGVYGKGAYPGYAGQLLVDAATGASYNAHGARGRKYLLPALFDPDTSACSTLV
ncbi:unnamed protein product [Miscanthus lutarioriparius]|uniref:Phi-1 n=1 Tax=Miscanthus lutarioriparius TaxID=422564 RepID=A0A811SED5_9POAL|nr:unnamed protein product [Miscanthus lutarioriparius]